MTTNHRTYSELSQYATFEDRFHYLQLHGTVRHDTFGFDRYLNQDFYQSREWRMFRDKIIVRDMGCDLGVPDHEITDWVIRNGKIIRPDTQRQSIMGTIAFWNQHSQNEDRAIPAYGNKERFDRHTAAENMCEFRKFD